MSTAPSSCASSLDGGAGGEYLKALSTSWRSASPSSSASASTVRRRHPVVTGGRRVACPNSAIDAVDERGERRADPRRTRNRPRRSRNICTASVTRRLETRSVLVDDCDEFAILVRVAAAPEQIAAAALIDVSGVLNSCASASRSVARSSPLRRAASAAVALRARAPARGRSPPGWRPIAAPCRSVRRRAAPGCRWAPRRGGSR